MKFKTGDNWLFDEESLEFFCQHCNTAMSNREISFGQLRDECMQITFLNVTQLHLKPYELSFLWFKRCSSTYRTSGLSLKL